MAHIDELARRGVGDQALLGIAVLPIVDPRQRTRGLGQRGMAGDVLDALVADPDDAPSLAKALEKLLAGPCAHPRGSCAGSDDPVKNACFPIEARKMGRDMLPG